MSNWFKSSYSANVGQCVEVDFETHKDIGYVAIRHSQRRRTGVMYTRAEWEAFIAGVKNGEFDWPEKEFQRNWERKL